MKECTKDKENINVPKFIKKDLMHIEFMRIIAIYLVLFNHTGKRGYALFTVAKENPMYWGYLFISILDRIAVPLFFMISGALLLGKEEKIQDIYRKRILKFIIILMVSSVIYDVYYWCFKNVHISFTEALVNIYI